MKGHEITEENLEDLLAYDDLFLDYFNAFLSLPAFPQAFLYNRLTGTFEEVQGSYNSINGTPQSDEEAAPYGATDEERDSMLQWAKEERLPMFLRTQLFREYKLCKLLLRPLDTINSAGRISRGGDAIRGYSRQTESCFSSLSNSADNSANEGSDYEDSCSWGELRKSALYKYERPGSRAVSLPPKLGLGDSTSCSENVSADLTESQPISRASKPLALKSESRKSRPPPPPPNQPTNHSFLDGVSDSGLGTSVGDPALVGEPTFATVIRNETLASIYEDGTGTGSPSKAPVSKSAKQRRQSKGKESSNVSTAVTMKYKKRAKHKRAISAPINYNDFMRIPTYSDFDAVFGEDEPEQGEPYVSFDDEAVSEQQTETDAKQLEGKHKMTLHQMKELVMSSMSGMEEFKMFLKDTAGNHLLNFWLDCEYYKDTMEDYDEISMMAVRNRLFRDITDKYKMNLTTDARDRLYRATSNASLSHTVFIRTQYDVLRRLRTYWMSRFMVHKERMNELSEHLEKIKYTAPEVAFPDRELSYNLLPSISVVNSLPVKHEEILHMAQSGNWDVVRKGGRAWDDRVRSARVRYVPKATQRTLREKLIIALSYDKVAGGPFQRFLERQPNSLLLSNLLFWQDVTDYGAEEDRAADRLLRMTHAWSIFNKYIAVGSWHSIGVDHEYRDYLHQQLLQTRDFIEVSLFDEAKNHAVDLLEKAWIRYLKEDLRTFLECQTSNRDEELSIATAEEIEVVLVKEKMVVRRLNRPWVRRHGPDGRYPGSTESERGRRLRTALSMAEEIDEAKKAEKRKKALERRKKMEKERRKAVRAARARQREAKKNKNAKPKEKTDQPAEGEEEEGGRGSHQGSIYGNISPAREVEEKPVEFLDMKGNKQMMGMFKKYIQENESKDVLNTLNLYNDIEAYLGIDNSAKKKKDVQAGYIYKNYMEHGSARKYVRLNDAVYNRLVKEKERPRSPTFREAQNYLLPNIQDNFKEFWKAQAEEMGVNEKNMANMSRAELAMRSDNDLEFNWSKKKGGKAKSTARQQPTKDDKVEFLMCLNQSVIGPMPVQMWYFIKFLVKHGEEENFPHLDKDLSFYIEVQKFKEMSHIYADEDLLKRKVAALNLCYLESNIPPALQIDVPADVHQKTLRAVQRYLAGKEMGPDVFDDAQYVVFKELLPFWAGFSKTYSPPDAKKKLPLTKQQKIFKKRLESFEHMEPPKVQFKLPQIPKGSTQSFSFSLTEGVKWRDIAEDHGDTMMTPMVQDIHAQSTSRMSKAGSISRADTNRSMLSVPGKS